MARIFTLRLQALGAGASIGCHSEEGQPLLSGLCGLSDPLAPEEEEGTIIAIIDQRRIEGAPHPTDLGLGPLDPASIPVGHGLKARKDAIFVLQPVEENVELKRPDGTHDRGRAGHPMLVEHLNRTLLGEFVEALVELFAAERIGELDPREVLRRKGGNGLEDGRTPRGEGIPDPKAPAVVDPHHIPGPGGLHRLAFLAKKLLGLGQPERLPRAHIGDRGSRYEAPRADPYEGQAISMLGVHIRLNLENEPGEPVVFGVNPPLARVPRGRRGGGFQEASEEGFDPEVGQCTPEEGGRHPSGGEPGRIQIGPHSIEQVDLLSEASGGLDPQQRLNFRVIQTGNPGRRTTGPVVTPAFEKVQRPVDPIVDPEEVGPVGYRPGDRCARHSEFGFDVVEELERRHPHPITLVDEGEDRNFPHPADLKQLPRLLLDPLAIVEEHDGRVRRHQRPIRVFREVLVTRGVQEIDPVPLVLELERRRGHRDPPFSLEFHPVGGGVSGCPSRLHRPRQMDGPTVEKELFGEGGLPRIGMADDGEGAASADLGLDRTQGGLRRQGFAGRSGKKAAARPRVNRRGGSQRSPLLKLHLL
jgi:hypothetical protein